VIESPDMHCIGYVCVTQRKDPEGELLRALLGGLEVVNSTTPVGFDIGPGQDGYWGATPTTKFKCRPFSKVCINPLS
jgi:hypothetical protein